MKVSTKQITETVAPLAEPVDLQEMKSHLGVTGADSDALISAQIIAVRQWAESYLQQSLVQRTYRADLWGFADLMELPLPPLASVTSVKYYNTDSPEVLTTLAATNYKVDVNIGVIYRAYGQTWPAVAYRHDAVQITYVTGYAADGTDYAGNVPECIKAATKLVVGDLFENRESKIVAVSHSVNPTAKMLLDLEREY